MFDPRNILVVDFGQLGDVVLSLPALRAIRKRFPHAQITVAVGKPGAEVIRLSQYANESLVVDRVALRDGFAPVSVFKVFQIVKDVRKRKFDFVIDLHSLSETNLLGFLSGAPRRLYARRPGRSIDVLANFEPRPQREAKTAHAVDRYLDVIKPLGIENPSRVPVLKTATTEMTGDETLLKKEKADARPLLVGIFPGAGHESRRWPLAHFAEIADHLIRNQGVRVIVFAGPEERAFVPQMQLMFPKNTIFLDKLTISQLVSAQARLTLLISNDTGPVHIAAAVGTPVVVIMDRPKPHSFTPIGEQHRLIMGQEITQISVEQVYRAAREVLSGSRTDNLRSL